MDLVKAQAFGNDFLLMTAADAASSPDLPALARRVCNRHRGIGADGLMVVTQTDGGAATRLLNADGSRSEISGNGIRCVAAWVARLANLGPGGQVRLDTEAGIRIVDILAVDGVRYTCRAGMGAPEALREETLDVGGTGVRVVVLRVGNPQCVVLGPPDHLTIERLHTVGAGLAVHPFFTEGTNVELATVEQPDRVRILI